MRTIHTELEGYGYKPLLKSQPIHVVGLEGTNFALNSIGIVPLGSTGRQEHGGVEVAGPWGFCTALLRSPEAAGNTFEVGEPFKVSGLPGVWTFASPRPRIRHLDGDGARLVKHAAQETAEQAAADEGLEPDTFAFAARAQELAEEIVRQEAEAAIPEGCDVAPSGTLTCDRGTKGCVLHHGKGSTIATADGVVICETRHVNAGVGA